MRPTARLLCIVGLALFWTAQIQGTAHRIAHLKSGSGLQDQAQTHSLICADCAAFSQAGAAPVAALEPAPLVASGDISPATLGAALL